MLINLNLTKKIILSLSIFFIISVFFVVRVHATTTYYPGNNCNFTNGTSDCYESVSGHGAPKTLTSNFAGFYLDFVKKSYLNGTYVGKTPVSSANFSLQGSKYTGQSSFGSSTEPWGPTYNLWNNNGGTYLWEYGSNGSVNSNVGYGPSYPIPPGEASCQYYEIDSSCTAGNYPSPVTNTKGKYTLSVAQSQLDCAFNYFQLQINIPSGTVPNGDTISGVNAGEYLGNNGHTIPLTATVSGSVITVSGIVLNNNIVNSIRVNLDVSSKNTCQLQLSSNNSNPNVGQSITLTATLSYSNGGNIGNQNIVIADTSGAHANPGDTSALTNGSGVATFLETDSYAESINFTALATQCGSTAVNVSWGTSTTSCQITLNTLTNSPQLGTDLVINVYYTPVNAPLLGVQLSASSSPAGNSSYFVLGSNTTTVAYSSTESQASFTVYDSVKENVTYTVSSDQSPNCNSSITINWSYGVASCLNGNCAPNQPICVRNQHQQLYVNGSIIAYGKIQDSRDLGGCNPWYPATQVVFNPAYVSIYNISFLKFIDRNLQRWQEVGI